MKKYLLILFIFLYSCGQNAYEKAQDALPASNLVTDTGWTFWGYFGFGAFCFFIGAVVTIILFFVIKNNRGKI
jgi:hypothetical protein